MGTDAVDGKDARTLLMIDYETEARVSLLYGVWAIGCDGVCQISQDSHPGVIFGYSPYLAVVSLNKCHFYDCTYHFVITAASIEVRMKL